MPVQAQGAQIVKVETRDIFNFILTLAFVVLLVFWTSSALIESRKTYYMSTGGLSMEQYLLQKHNTTIVGGNQSKLSRVFSKVIPIHATPSDKNDWVAYFPDDGVAFIGDSLILIFTDNPASVGAKLGTEIKAKK